MVGVLPELQMMSDLEKERRNEKRRKILIRKGEIYLFVVYTTNSTGPLITASVPQEKVLVVQNVFNEGQFDFRAGTG